MTNRWLSPRTIDTMQKLQRQYALSCLDPRLHSTNSSTAYNTPLCHLLYTQMHSPDPIRGFKATQAWSISHFLHHCDGGDVEEVEEGERVRRLLERPELLQFDEIKRQFLYNERLVVGVGWVWLVRPYQASSSPHPTPRTSPQTLIKVVRVPAGRAPTTCPDTHTPCLPILGVNLWEHAYIADFGVERQAFVEAWWQRVRWSRVLPVLASACTSTSGTAVYADERRHVRYV